MTTSGMHYFFLFFKSTPSFLPLQLHHATKVTKAFFIYLYMPLYLRQVFTRQCDLIGLLHTSCFPFPQTPFDSFLSLRGSFTGVHQFILYGPDIAVHLSDPFCELQRSDLTSVQVLNYSVLDILTWLFDVQELFTNPNFHPIMEMTLRASQRAQTPRQSLRSVKFCSLRLLSSKIRLLKTFFNNLLTVCAIYLLQPTQVRGVPQMMLMILGPPNALRIEYKTCFTKQKSLYDIQEPFVVNLC